MPLLSVICGAYNIASEPVAEKSIESLLAQSFRDFEIIICNDGSTDATDELLRRYAKQDSRIRIIKNEKNQGLAYSLNRCLSLANGSYIARHDFDDISLNTRFEKQIYYLEEHGDIDILGVAVALFDENGIFDEEYFPALVRAEDFLYTSPYKHGTVIFKKDSLISAGGYRVAPETVRTEDYELFMRMCAMGYKGANLMEILYLFKEDTAAKSRRKYKYRIDEAWVRARGFFSLGLIPRGIPYIIKPLIVGLMPRALVAHVQKKRREKWRRYGQKRI